MTQRTFDIVRIVTEAFDMRLKIFSLLELLCHITFHLIEQAHQVVKIRLDLLLKHFHDVDALATVVLSPLLIVLGQLVPLIESVNIFECLAEWAWHLLV